MDEMRTPSSAGVDSANVANVEATRSLGASQFPADETAAEHVGNAIALLDALIFDTWGNSTPTDPDFGSLSFVNRESFDDLQRIRRRLVHAVDLQRIGETAARGDASTDAIEQLTDAAGRVLDVIAGAPRKVVTAFPVNDVAVSAGVWAMCDDGTLWVSQDMGWSRWGLPIPGTAADIARHEMADHRRRFGVDAEQP